MAWVVIEHEDGRRFSVADDDPRATGEEAYWTVEGAERPETFVPVGIPPVKRPRRKPAAKDAAPLTGDGGA